MNQQIAVREEAGLTKEGLDHTRDQLILLENFVKDVLRKDEDYGVIPGTNGKNTLLKPGAANITAAFNCHAEPTVDASEMNPDTGFVSYEVHVDLVSNLTGHVMTRGVGSCNSYEKKYRYRWEGGGDSRHQIVNEDPLEQANTIKKMATKRAEVDAAMRLPGVARFFTQDLEDMEPGDTSTETKPATPKDNRYWCAEHRTEWFKKGKMRGYAHPSAQQGGPWCYMKDAPIATSSDLNDEETLRNSPSEQAGPEPGPQATEGPSVDGSPRESGDLVNPEEIIRYAMSPVPVGLGYLNRQAVFAVKGVQVAFNEKRPQDAMKLLEAAKKP